MQKKVDFKTYKALDATNIAVGNGFKHHVLPATNAAASKPTDSAKSGSKYSPGDKSDKYKSVHFSDKNSNETYVLRSTRE